MTPKLYNFAGNQKPKIQVVLTSEKETYTTDDIIEGVATITAPINVRFDMIDIEFVGTSRTHIDCTTTAAGRSEASHQFLKLSQPDLHHHYPIDLVFEADRTYCFPFRFAVPRQLLPHVCQHNAHNNATHECHLQPPPSFGEDLKGTCQNTSDDMAPKMAGVWYEITVRITELKPRPNDVRRCIVASRSRNLRVIPAVQEQPPLDVGTQNNEYLMREERLIKERMFKGKLGTLVMEAAQPRPLQLKSLVKTSETATMARVSLRFDPDKESCPPPKLGDLFSKLQTTTHFVTTGRNTLLINDGWRVDSSQSLYREQLKLSSCNVASVQWKRQDPSAEQKFVNPISSAMCPETDAPPQPSTGYHGGPYYTAYLLVPITLPSNKTFVPTFHSCLISRVYSLTLHLNINTVGMCPGIRLNIPVQIITNGLGANESEVWKQAEGSGLDIDDEGFSAFHTSRFDTHTNPISSCDVPDGLHSGSQGCGKDSPPKYSDIARGLRPLYGLDNPRRKGRRAH